MAQLGIGNVEAYRGFLKTLSVKPGELNENLAGTIAKIGEFVDATGLASLQTRYNELQEVKEEFKKLVEVLETYAKDGRAWVAELDALNEM